jgi:NitT/TauT family transport system ATP-binding protein
MTVAPISLNDVTHHFGGAPVLANVSLTIAPGEFVTLVGPSGCGKSTLLRLLADLIRPSQGKVESPGGRPRAAFVFQEPTLLPWRTAVENVRLPLEIARHESSLTPDSALAVVGLKEDDHRKFPRQLSGGMRMRVSLARAMIMQPELLLLDEPFAALDDLLRQQLNEELLRLWSDGRWSAVFVTHNVAEAVYLSQRVIVMSARPGQIASEVHVPFDYPRSPKLRSQPEFAALVGRIGERLQIRPEGAKAG